MKFYWEDITSKKYRIVYDYQYQSNVIGFEARTEFIDLDFDGLLTIRKNWLYDGPSGPTYDSPGGMRAAAIHDAFYYLMRLGLVSTDTRRRVDTIFYEVMIEDGMPRDRAEIWFQGVARFAAYAAKPGSEPREKIFCIGKD